MFKIQKGDSTFVETIYKLPSSTIYRVGLKYKNQRNYILYGTTDVFDKRVSIIY